MHNETVSEPGQSDFRIIACAVLLYHQQHRSLFADEVVSNEIGLPTKEIRALIENWFGQPVEKVVACLHPESIKLRIRKTREYLLASRKEETHVQITRMSESEMGDNEKKIIIRYQYSKTPFGNVLIASTGKGICYLAFADEGKAEAFEKLKERFPYGLFLNEENDIQKPGLVAFEPEKKESQAVPLHLKATPFQIETWNKLLRIPAGGLLSYSELAADKRYSHATGNAVGSNPVAYLIPCHRMVPSNGEFGEYHWGKARKAALICMEALNQTVIN